jgi:hypothetical protein
MELLTEQPTLGCIENPADRPIFQNIFPEPVPFHISHVKDYDANLLYRKIHNPPTATVNELIFIVRNPREVLLRNTDYTFIKKEYDNYFACIDYYTQYTGRKHLFYYEDLVTDKPKFINELANFLQGVKSDKLEYVLENVDKLYNLSKVGKNRSWGGVNSSGIHFYYDKLAGPDKIRFDKYIADKMATKNYDLLREKYGL